MQIRLVHGHTVVSSTEADGFGGAQRKFREFIRAEFPDSTK